MAEPLSHGFQHRCSDQKRNQSADRLALYDHYCQGDWMHNADLLLGIYLSIDHLSRLCYDGYSVWHPTSSHAEVQ